MTSRSQIFMNRPRIASLSGAELPQCSTHPHPAPQRPPWRPCVAMCYVDARKCPQDRICRHIRLFSLLPAVYSDKNCLFRQKQGRVFICRLFQRSYCDEHSSSENTIQWTILLFVWLSALFPLHFCTDCTVMYASDPAAQTVLSPDTDSILTESIPFETYLSPSSSTI